MTDTLEIYQTAIRKQWRWRYRAANGHILADGGQGYSRRIACLSGARHVMGVDSTLLPGDVVRRGERRLLVRVVPR